MTSSTLGLIGVASRAVNGCQKFALALVGARHSGAADNRPSHVVSEKFEDRVRFAAGPLGKRLPNQLLVFCCAHSLPSSAR
jgi:hypothetical protein